MTTIVERMCDAAQTVRMWARGVGGVGPRYQWLFGFRDRHHRDVAVQFCGSVGLNEH
jgi:hypothetical protein